MKRALIKLQRMIEAVSATGLMFVVPAYATPPRPPVTLEQVEINDEKESKRADRAVLRIRLAINASSLFGGPSSQQDHQGSDVQVNASLTPLMIDASGTARNKAGLVTKQIFTVELKLEGDRGAELEIPLKDLAMGEYRIDVRLSGRRRDSTGFADHLVRYVRVDAKGQLFVSDAQ